MVKAVTQTAPDVEIGWSRRRHASGRRSGGVRHSGIFERLAISIFSYYFIIHSIALGPNEQGVDR